MRQKGNRSISSLSVYNHRRKKKQTNKQGFLSNVQEMGAFDPQSSRKEKVTNLFPNLSDNYCVLKSHQDVNNYDNYLLRGM